jgi:calcineurin-like phosphoesterase family protein
MDAVTVERINERVGRGGILFILGDFTLSRNAHYVEHLFHAIACRKILVLGNHDLDHQGRVKQVIASLPWEMPPVAVMEIKDGPDGSRVWLSHYAHRSWPASHHGSYHFYGHSHGALPPLHRSRDVGIDCPYTGLGPMIFDDLTGEMA